MTPIHFVKSLTPPMALNLIRRVRRKLMGPPNGLTFAPDGWRTYLPPGQDFECPSHLKAEQRKWEDVWQPFASRMCTPDAVARLCNDVGSQRVGDHNGWMTYAYVLHLAAGERTTLKVLDYGSNLGYFHLVAKALMPHITLDYHCKDLPQLAELGRKLNPAVTWHSDDSCLEQEYDLILFKSVLQYIRDWRHLIAKAAGATRKYVYLSAVPTVRSVPGFVAIQQFQGNQTLYQQIRLADLLQSLSQSGLSQVCEFVEAESEHIHDAPEQPTYFGALFEKSASR